MARSGFGRGSFVDSSHSKVSAMNLYRALLGGLSTVAVLLSLAVCTPSAEAQLPRRQAKQLRPGQGNEVEGALWVYTATIAKQDKKLSGKFRIDGRAIFAANARRVAAEQEKRIGDAIVVKGKPMQLSFTDSPDLDGRAILEWNSKLGMWVGHYDEKNGKRWKFELRRGDD
jgi:hypothetical protein